MKVTRGFVILILCLMFVCLGTTAYVFFSIRHEQSEQAKSEQKARDDLADSERRARVALVASQRRGCARGKKDRQDNADFQKAHSKYISKVTSAKSVKEDVKHAAREAQLVFKRTSTRLELRSKINCKKAFP